MLEIYFSCCRSKRTNTAWTEYNEENGAEIYKEQQNQARCDPLEVKSITRQGAAGLVAEAQCSRPANYTQTPTGQGYVKPRHSNNKIPVSFSEGLSSVVSLHNRQLRSIFPATKLPANSKAVMASPLTRQVHSRLDAQSKEFKWVLPTQPVRLQEPQSKKWSKPGEVLSRTETSQSHVVETQKVLAKEIEIHGTQVGENHMQEYRHQLGQMKCLG